VRDSALPVSLITGGSGFIGLHLTDALVARGRNVRVLDRTPPRRIPPRTEFVRASVLDRDVVAAALDDVDCVYHLAAIAQLWTPDPSQFQSINVDGTRLLLELVRPRSGVRFVHCSSETVLLGATSEDAILTLDDMAGPYSRSKLAAEQLAREAAQAGLDVVIVNPTLPIGPDESLTPPTAMLARFLGESVHAFVECSFNVVDVRDVAAGMILAAERGRRGERYVLGGETMQLSEMIDLLAQITGGSRIKFRVPGWLGVASAAIAEQVANVTKRKPFATREGVRLALASKPIEFRKARAELGYAPRPIHKALKETAQWLLQRQQDGSAVAVGRGRASEFSD
jgi:dihydroflavonol-4-reductase